MHSPRLREATQVFFQSCCPIPLIGVPEPDRPVSKTKSTSSANRDNFVATTKSLFQNTYFTNHESIPSLQESFVQFIKAYPNYSDTAPIDQIRAREYSDLSISNHVCLDYIGVGLFSQSQTSSSSSSKQSDLPLLGVSFKSVSLKSQLLHGGEGSEVESAIKKRIMDFLNISPSDYTMVFTANRSSAFKLVGESYPFSSSRKLLTVYDHKNEAVDAMTSASEKRGARVLMAEFKWPRLRIHSTKLRKMIARKKKKKENHRGLLVFPLQSRMSGASYSYQWMTMAQEHGWHVMLDACALSPKDMDSFGLSLIRPDFLVASFYKVFGENPSGFGCLFVKKSVVPILEPSAGSGIATIVQADQENEAISGPQQIVPFEQKSNENQVECRGLDHVDSLGLMLVSNRGRYLINWLVMALMKLQHPNRLDNFQLVTIYGPKVKFDRGPALAFNIHDWKGEMVEAVLVQKLADRNNISLGHGLLNNIWFSDEKQSKSREGIAVVTAALTFLANFEDAYRLWAFVAQFLDADFVEKERWRYTSLNQNTIEM